MLIIKARRLGYIGAKRKRSFSFTETLVWHLAFTVKRYKFTVLVTY